MLKRIWYYLFSLQSKLFGGMTIFSKIIAGEIPSYKIAENDKFFAFLDIFPLREGHVLVVPKSETDNFFDLPAGYKKFSMPAMPSGIPRNTNRN